jgi:hypothetical protein
MAESNSSQSGDPDHHFAPASLPSNTDYRHARLRRPVFAHPSRSLPSERIRNTRLGTHDIVVVGVCSSGKSSLVRALQSKGYEICAVSQEHSYVPNLWQRSKPNLLVYLDATVHTIRGRGRTRWQQSFLDEEHRRLQHARDHCHLYIATDGLSPEDVASRVVTFLKTREMRNEA